MGCGDGWGACGGGEECISDCVVACRIDGSSWGQALSDRIMLIGIQSILVLRDRSG